MTTKYRHDRLGVHSIGEFRLQVPSLEDAERFYSAFGLDVRLEAPQTLTLRTNSSQHIWGRLCLGPRKKFESITLHCFEEDYDRLKAHVLAQGINLVVPPAGHDLGGFWLLAPDNIYVQVRPGAKTTPDEVKHRSPLLPNHGTRCAPYRRNTRRVNPTRLSHIALMTTDVPAQIEFFSKVLGLRLSDRSGDLVAFMHAPHGGDHHLIAFAKSSNFALHHLSWDVPTIEEVGLGMMQIQAAGYLKGWGVGRHVLGSNYFYYAQDPWGSHCEYSATMDYIPAALDWISQDHPAEDGMYLWGPDIPEEFLQNSERPVGGSTHDS